MSSWARVGAKCQIVDVEVYDARTDVSAMPPQGEVLIITKVHKPYSFRGEHFRIQGYPNIDLWGEDIGWRGFRFLPLTTKSQEDDISMFKSLLKPTEVPA